MALGADYTTASPLVLCMAILHFACLLVCTSVVACSLPVLFETACAGVCVRAITRFIVCLLFIYLSTCLFVYLFILLIFFYVLDILCIIYLLIDVFVYPL